MVAALNFLKNISMLCSPKMQDRISQWSKEDSRRHQAKTAEEEIAMLTAQQQKTSGVAVYEVDIGEIDTKDEDLMAMDVQ